MAIKWKKEKFEPQLIIDMLSKNRNPDFNTIQFFWDIRILQSMIDFDCEISKESSEKIIYDAINAAQKNYQTLTKDNVLKAIKKSFRDHKSKPLLEYYLVTTLNISLNNKLANLKLNKCHLSFYKNLPFKYQASRKQIISTVSNWLIDKDESFVQYVVIKTTDRSADEAVPKMLDALDLVRGLWNLHLVKSYSVSFGRDKQINKVTIGALHSVHNKKGDGTDGFWYEPNHFKNYDRIDLVNAEYDAIAFTKKVRKLLNKHNYRKHIESCIIRHNRALDTVDYDAAVLKLWSLLEELTCTGKDSYDKTIKRVLSIFPDRDYQKQVLEHLRTYRNGLAHASSQNSDSYTCALQLNNYVTRLLMLHIKNKLKFKSMSEFAKYMDLGSDISALKKNIYMYKSRVEYLSGKRGL